jgi:hypothetical protein
MNARMIVSHLVVAVGALWLGWTLATSTLEEAAPGSAVGSSEGLLGSSLDPSLDTEQSPVSHFAELLVIEDPAERTVALAKFFRSADPAWAQRLRDEVNSEGSELVLDEISETLFASWWARSDPESAFTNRVDPAWANRHPWVRAVFREWMKVDAMAAVEAIDTLPTTPGRGRLEASRVVLDEWFQQDEVADPTPLLALLPHLEPKTRARAIKRMMTSMIETRGLEATEEFALSVPSDSDTIGTQIQPEIMARMGIALLGRDVDRAIEWANRHGEGRRGVGIRKHLAFHWGLQDGPAALQWAMGLPDSPERSAVIKRAWLSFNRKQPEEARAWLMSREPDELLQGIYARFLTHLAQNDPDRARSLAETAKDAAVRERMLVAVGKGWMKADPKGAETWLKGSGLSPTAREQIENSARQTQQDGVAG